MTLSKTKTNTLLALMTVGMTLYCYRLFADGQSPDLMATWIAGHFFAAGALDQVYPKDTTVFSMLPPSQWWDFLGEQNRQGPVFPYVYPPLWAALAGPMTAMVGMQAFQNAASIINPVLITGMIILACRAADLRGAPLVLATGLGLAIMLVTLSGAVALEQNQPQILVSFLLVAAIERDRAGAAKAAGLALALAAAIKLYPAALALLWLVAGQRKSATAFAAFGAALGLLSVALAGWPLHAEFLHQVGVIKDTVLVTYFTYGFDQIVSQLAYPGDGTFIAALDNEPGAAQIAGWTVLEKGALWSGVSTASLLALLGAGAVWLRRQGNHSVLFWPALLVGIGLLSPLSWGYHYLPALAFVPAMALRYGLRTGGLILLAILFPISIAALDLLVIGTTGPLVPQIAGTLAMVGLGVALLLAPAPQTATSAATTGA